MADQYAGSDVTRMAMDGANAGTTFSDSLGHTYTAAGAGVTTSTLNARYGTASMLTTGAATAYINAATSADWNFGSGNFCIDFWYYPTSMAQLNNLMMSIANGAGTPNVSISYNSSGALIATVNVGGVITLQTPSNMVYVNRWNHVAFVRNGVNATLYVNGSPRATVATLSTTAITFSSDSINFGGSAASGATGSYIGYMDMVRVTKGQARYTGAFVPPLDSFNSLSPNVMITNTGTNTRTVSPLNEISHDAILAGVDSAIQALGWSMYDIIYKNGGGQITVCYRAINKDATTYKYALLVQDRPIYSFAFTCCESWDLTTQAILNEAYTANRNHRFGYTMNYTDITVMGTARYLGFVSTIRGSMSPGSFVFEMEREAPEDTTTGALPCWVAWSTVMGCAASYTSNYLFAPCRTRDGRTGISAIYNQTLITSINAYGYNAVASRWWDIMGDYTYNTYTAKYAWDSNKRIVTSFKPVHNETTSRVVSTNGRLYGIKGVGNMTGSQWDRVSVPVDSDQFYSAGGSATDHWVINATNQGYGAFSTSNANISMPGSSVSTNAYNIGQIAYSMVQVNQFIYCATANGLIKVDTVTGTVTTVTGPSGVVADVCFDGRYVYCTTTLGVSRNEVNNADAWTGLTIGTGGLQSICWDGASRLFASYRTASTTQSIVCIDTGTFTQLGAVMVAPARVTASLISNLTASGIGDVMGVYFNQTTAADTVLVVVDANKLGIAISQSPSQVYQMASVTWTGYNWQFISHVAASTVGHYEVPYGFLGSPTTYVVDNTFSITAAANNSYYRFNAYRTIYSTIVLATAARTSNAGIMGINNTWTTTNFGAAPLTVSTTWSVRTGFATPNQIVHHMNDNNVYVVGNLYSTVGQNPSTAAWQGGQFLIPR